MRRVLLCSALFAAACTSPSVDYTGKQCDVACPSGYHCNALGTCEKGGGCPAGTTLCGKQCVALQGDPANCGRCGNACAVQPHTTGPACVLGQCAAGPCAAGYLDCDTSAGSGCETSADDPYHCGTCGNACVLANAVAGCARGACNVQSCDPGFDDCDKDPSNGCEANTGSDPDHCGTCTNACPAAAHATPACNGGSCGFVCDTGWGDCDGDPSNGCEADLGGDPNHCGTCAAAPCPAGPNATAGCNAGKCTVTCAAGWADCDGDPTNGCETPTDSDPNHCGGCTACAIAHATASCTGGVCGLASCLAGYSDCDGDPSNGCETSTTNDPSHCGGCGACALANVAVDTCSNSTCGIGACATSYANCDTSQANGCEQEVDNDPLHCGSCTKVCPAAPHAQPGCANSACTLVCDPGFADADGNPANGCEACVPTNGGVEICDGLDNDCNGVVDDGVGCCVSTVAVGAPAVETGLMAAEAGAALYVADPGKGVDRVDLASYAVALKWSNAKQPVDLGADGAGGAFVISSQQVRLYDISSTGAVTTSAGTGSVGCLDSANNALQAQFSAPGGLAVVSPTRVIVADTGNQRLVDVAPWTSNSNKGSAVNYASSCGGTTFSAPKGLAWDGANVWVADSGNKAVKKVADATKIVTTVASGLAGAPLRIAVDAAGNVYFTQSDSVWKLVGGAGPAVKVAGGGTCAATFTAASGLAVRAVSTGVELYVLDNGTVKRIAGP